MLIGLHFPSSRPDARNADWPDVVEVLMARGVSVAHMARLLNVDPRRADRLIRAARGRFIVPEPESLSSRRRASTFSRFEELAASAWQDALASPDPMVRARFYSLALACYGAVAALGNIAGVTAEDPAGERQDAEAFRKKYGLADADVDALGRLLSPSTEPVPTNRAHLRDGDVEP